MNHITILVPEGENNLSSIVGSYKILSRANQFWQEQQQKKGFTIELAGSTREIEFHGGLFSARPHRTIDSIGQTSLIIIPSLGHQFDTAIHLNKKLIGWIQKMHAGGSAIASICTGSFLLAASGLLDDKTCSTHWAFAGELQQRFPAIHVKADQLITDEDGIYTNGGAYSFLNLLLYLIEKYFDRSTAIFCAKVFQIEIDRFQQAEFILFRGQKSHPDEQIRQVQEFMEKQFREMPSIQELASRFAIGRRSFDRRFIKATGNSPLEYLQRLKIEAAKKAFETSTKNVSEVMASVGYADQKAFREVFRKITGLSPLQYRNKYNRTLAY